MVLRSRLILLSIISVFILACSGSGENVGQEAINAKALYEKKCSLCHGNDGQLNLAGASDLSKSALSLEDRINVITNGKNNMTPFKAVLSEDEIKAVAIYIENFRKP
jgi:mono/diheme cytochrome c family protein